MGGKHSATRGPWIDPGRTTGVERLRQLLTYSETDSLAGASRSRASDCHGFTGGAEAVPPADQIRGAWLVRRLSWELL